MDIQQIHQNFLRNPSISIDSREIIPGSIFFALKGDHFDGNEYAKIAIEKGASFAVIDNPEYIEGSKYILVENSLTCLQDLANFHRKTLKTKIIAITGTNGKTTTKELLNGVLSSQFECVATKGNFNNHIGVPLTVLSINQKHDFAIVEMGANHIGEIDFLCKIAMPDFGLITNIGKAHLEGFGSVKGVLKTKTELYRHLKNHSGKAFIHSGNEILMENSVGLEKETYGSKADNVYGEVLESFPFLKIKLKIDNAYFEFRTNLIGTYNLENILVAACVGNYFKVDHQKIVNAIQAYSPANNRSQLIEKNSNKILLDAYNANPSSMKAAIENFYVSPGKQKLLILGDMLELGNDSFKEHKAILDLIIDLNFEHVIFIGREFFKLQIEEFSFFLNLSEAMTFLNSNKFESFEILLKASRGIGLEELVSSL